MNNTLSLKVLQGNTRKDGDSDWHQAFEYAGDFEHEGPHNGSISLSACIDTDTDTSPVLRGNVTRIVSSAEGENDGFHWLIVVELNDGRFAFLTAGCDYTGWGCQAGGHCIVDTDLNHLIQFGLGEEDRSRLGLYAV